MLGSTISAGVDHHNSNPIIPEASLSRKRQEKVVEHFRRANSSCANGRAFLCCRATCPDL
jgi:hypothetical protein